MATCQAQPTCEKAREYTHTQTHTSASAHEHQGTLTYGLDTRAHTHTHTHKHTHTHPEGSSVTSAARRNMFERSTTRVQTHTPNVNISTFNPLLTLPSNGNTIFTADKDTLYHTYRAAPGCVRVCSQNEGRRVQHETQLT